MKDAGFYEITGGLEEGQEVVTAGNYQIKSKLYDEFKLHYGTSPMSYLRKYRLQQIHKILSSPQVHSKVSISQLAYQWGFTHLSRFADEYKQEFGEKPSETKSKYA